MRAEIILRTPENKTKVWDAGKVPKRRPVGLRRLRLPDLPRRALFVGTASARHSVIHKRADYKEGSFAARVARKLRFETATRARATGWKSYVRRQGEMNRKDLVESADLLLEPVDLGYDLAEDSEREFGFYDMMDHVTGIHA